MDSQLARGGRRALALLGTLPQLLNDSWSRRRWGTNPQYKPLEARRFLRSLRLNGSYSDRLYGAPGRMPSLDELQIIWLDMLPPEIWERLQLLGVCRADMPSPSRSLQGASLLLPPVPQGSLYMPQSKMANPHNSLWYKQPAGVANTPVDAHEWVEVTHCPSPWCTLRTSGWNYKKSVRGRGRVSASASCRDSGAWFFAARGSGVAINVGRTLVIDEDQLYAQHGQRLPQREGRGTGREPSAWLNDAIADLRSTATRSLRYARSDFYRANKLAAVLNLSASAILRLDSVQRVWHREGFSSVARHEVHLLDASQLNDAHALHWKNHGRIIRCGRPPHLENCTADTQQLTYMSKCTPPGKAFEWNGRRTEIMALLRSCWSPSMMVEDAEHLASNFTTRGNAPGSINVSAPCTSPSSPRTTGPVAAAARLWRRNMSALPPLQHLRRIFWSHFPKCGTNFGRTVFTYACTSAVGDPHLITTRTGIPRFGGDCSGSRSLLQSGCWQTRLSHRERWGIETDMGTWLHQPVVWEHTGKVPWVHPAVGNVVVVFRQPQARLLSSLVHLARHSGHCCGEGWGFGQRGRKHLIDISGSGLLRRLLLHMANSSVPHKERWTVAMLRSCQTKMLLGFGCFSPHKVTHLETVRAVRLVQTELAFVGIFEQWDAMVCLWHARFGGWLWSHQLWRAGTVPPTTTTEDRLRLANPRDLISGHDPDKIVYSAATRRFDRERQAYSQLVQGCLERTLETGMETGERQT